MTTLTLDSKYQLTAPQLRELAELCDRRKEQAEALYKRAFNRMKKLGGDCPLFVIQRAKRLNRAAGHYEYMAAVCRERAASLSYFEAFRGALEATVELIRASCAERRSA